MPQCSYCGKEIRFLKRSGKKAVAVEIGARYYMPDEGSEVYVQRDGHIRKGRLVADGILGYRLHDCREGGRRNESA